MKKVYNYSCKVLLQSVNVNLDFWHPGLSKFLMLDWIRLLSILLVLLGVEILLCLAGALSWNAITCFVELS